MSSLSSRLCNKVKVYGKVSSENELYEVDDREELIAELWCDIVPKNGRVEELTAAASRYESITHEVIFRRSAEKYLSAENVIVYRGQRLEIEYILPHYNEPDRVVAYCREEVNK